MSDLNLQCVKDIVDYLHSNATDVNTMYFMDDFPFANRYSHFEMNIAVESLVKNGYVLFDEINGNNKTSYRIGKLTSLGEKAYQQFLNL